MASQQKFSYKLQKVAGTIQQNRYMSAISNGLMSTLPFLIIGAFATLFSALAWEPYQNLIAPVKAIIGLASTMTTGIIALYAVFFIAYRLAQAFDKDPLVPAATALLSFLIVTPIQTFDKVRALPLQWLGAQGLFVAMIVGLIAARLYIWIVDRNWTIKMPDGVPPTVVKTFSGLIPAVLVALVFVIVAGLFMQTSFGTVHDFIYTYLQIPLEGLGGSLGALIIALIIMQALWMFGIHGAIVILAIVKPIWMSLDLANLDAFQAGAPLPNIIGLAFWSIFCNYAPMLGFALLLVFLAKSKQLRTIGKLGLPGTFFSIHEPLIFGIPMVLNPLLAIPFIVAPIICAVLGYIATNIGLLPAPIGIYPPFGTPIFALGFIEGSWKLAAAQLVLIPISMLIYYPFFRALDKQALKKEHEAQEQLEKQASETTASPAIL
ncbi:MULTISPECIES: PTS transporter subunit EIIC [Paenibacillus]|uniref:PTS sugar transporter subunit IIC n=1 Tax=Paenibacillus TaxID=44249 RepID=UPI0004726BB9|nr:MULTISPECIES: PTS transporter subunit EIIC [Paenibacillus]AJE52511.1 PTS cellbiose transporter subunit IIC [Paenibacillus polymyxa]AZH31078.1 PTS sugar transporter subunit IIC [Paenibacillus sp. M-152]MBU9708023.1 PTS transporter subunit EIIC [Paenibacillus sp. AK121]MEE4567673.1 PTS transporter subunit EIIC [Paenibacillus polymyxa]OAZ46741.1 PTS cellbiose transporter subunit IIC [Paenibacillus polymyxa]